MNGGKSWAKEKMNGRRSSRQKRAIDYRQFADKNSDDDDDFESSLVLPKKQRQEEKRHKKVANATLAGEGKSSEQQSVLTSDPPKKGRQSRDERQFDKDVEKALRDSTREISNSPDAAEVCQKTPEHTSHPQSVKKGKDSDYQPPKDDIEDDFFSGSDSASDSDSDVSAPPPKKTKAKSVKSTTRQTQWRLKDSEATVLSPKVPLTGCHGTPGLGMRRMPNWTPPGPAGRENLGDSKAMTVSIGGTPTIRVGLSRNARVKPLHSNCLPNT